MRTRALTAIGATATGTPLADRGAYTRTLISALQARPEILSAGADGAGNIWARFTDGVGLIIYLDRQGSSAPPTNWAGVPQIGSVANLPTSNTVRVIDYFANLGLDSNLSAWAAKRNYGTATVVDATLDNFRSFDGVGIGVVSTHGGSNPLANCTQIALRSNGSLDAPSDCPREYSLLSKTPRDPTAESGSGMIADDFSHRRLNLGFDLSDATSPCAASPCYTVGAAFVSNYWDFSAGLTATTHSVLYNASCEGNSSQATDFWTACLLKGLDTYLGWSGDVHSTYADGAGQMLFDRLFGINAFEPEAPNQRPFPLDDVLKWGGHGWFSDPGSGATLGLQPSSHSFGLLDPSISYVEVDEGAHLLKVHGAFPDSQPSDSSVTIGACTPAIQNWSSTLVTAALPATSSCANGAAQNVQVIAQKHPSNSVPLTEWTTTIDFIWQYKPTNANGPGWTVDLNMQVYFRADIHAFRQKIATTPQTADALGMPIRVRATDYSKVSITGSGQFDNGPNTTQMLTCPAPPANSLSFSSNWTWFSIYQTDGFVFAGTIHPANPSIDAIIWFWPFEVACTNTTPSGSVNVNLFQDGTLLIENYLAATQAPRSISLGAGSAQTLTNSPMSNPGATYTLQWTDFTIVAGQPDPSKGEDMGL